MIKHLTCADCGSSFTYDHRKGPTRQRCESCRVARKKATDQDKTRRWREANPGLQEQYARAHYEKRIKAPGYKDYTRKMAYKYNYGITVEEYDAMLAEQGGVCRICKGPHRGVGKRFHVDHCHDSSKVRGLLCGPCNTAIGLLKHDPDLLRQAIEYLGTEGQ